MANHFRFLAVALLGLSVAALRADTFTYTAPTTSNTSGAPDLWSAGTSGFWSATPVSATNTTLVITGPPTIGETRFSANDLSAGFQLNVLTLTGTGPDGAGDTATMTLQGNSLSFVADGANQPVVNLNANHGASTSTYSFVVNNALSLSATTTFQGNGTATANFAGAISGAGGISKTGTSLLQISSASNTYAGATNVSNGTLSVGTTNALPSATAVTVSGSGLLDFTGKGDTIASLSITGSGTINNTQNAIVITGAMTNSSTSTGGSNAAFVVNSGGRITINGLATFGANSQTLMGGGNGTRLNFNGGLSMTGATIRMNTGADSKIVLGGNVTINDPGNATSSAIANNGTGTLASGLDLNGGTRTITVADGTATIDFTVAAVVQSGTGTGALIKAGAGTMALTNTNTFTGGTTVSAGELMLQANGAGGAGSVTVAPGADLDLSSASITTGAVADTATLSLSNTGSTYATLSFGSSTLNETVGGLQIDGVPMASGVYNASNLPNYITGSGSLTVVPEPGCVGLLLMGAGLLGIRRRRR